jgi:hypothetical protein
MDHRKFRRLVALLGIGPAQTRGHLEMLWDSAYQNGDAYIGDQTDVELEAGWTGDTGVLCKAFVECGGVGPGFIDAREDGLTFDVHDLFDHAPEYVKSRWRMERKRREAGARVRKEKESLGTVSNSSEQSGKGYASPAPAPVREDKTNNSPGAADAAPVAPALTLTSPVPGKGNGKTRRGANTNPDHKRLVDHYATEFKRTQGAPPLLEKDDFAAVASVLAGRTFEEAARIVTAFLEKPDDWSKERGLLRLRDLPAAVTKILARASPPRSAAMRAGLDDERRSQFAAMDEELNRKGASGGTD